jgi:hypothetical protein
MFKVAMVNSQGGLAEGPGAVCLSALALLRPGGRRVGASARARGMVVA